MTEQETMGAFLVSHRAAFFMRLAEHLLLTGTTIAAAFIVGLALAILAFRKPWLRVPLLGFTSMLQTIPGIALLVMAMALLHRIGTAPALLALLFYALLPIVQTTLVGLTSLSPALAEAARGLGLSKWQRLRHVRLPLALPMIMAGLRTSAVQTVGLATLAAFVGAGGLGQFINRGLFLSDTRLILLGAIPAALMALLIHGLLSQLGMAAEPGRPRAARRAMAAAALLMIAGLGIFTAAELHQSKPLGMHITIGSKNFTEQWIVAEIVAQQIEHETHLTVERRFGLGGSNVVHAALTEGTIDIAVEYTGTALASILHLPIPGDRAAVFPTVRDTYAARYRLTWLPPLGFDNTYLLAVRADDARLAQVTTLSGLTRESPQLNAAFDFEFAERADGYKGLQQRYGLDFKKISDMHPDLLYPALHDHTADVISAYATDGRLADARLRTLRDDQSFFPPYEAAIVVRDDTLNAHPELKAALAKLSGRLTTDAMRRLNAAVDHKQMTVEKAAAQALSR